MLVVDILRKKGGEVVAVPPEATVQDAAKVLSAHRIGAVLVRDAGGAVLGILSERDIVKALAHQGEAALAESVTEWMTRNVVTCEPGDAIASVMETMTRRRIRHLPVTEGGELIGVVSIGDVVKHRIDETLAEVEAMTDYLRS
jgi:CBS domain-containing protein